VVVRLVPDPDPVKVAPSDAVKLASVGSVNAAWIAVATAEKLLSPVNEIEEITCG